MGDEEIGRMIKLGAKAEDLAKVEESGHMARDKTPGFEPEILAFCCEH